MAAALCASICAAAAAACGGSTSVETVVGPDGVRCQTTLAGPSSPVPANGGTVNVSIDAARDCTWTAAAETAWMQLNATSGQGNATLTVTVARNDLPATRSGAVTVNSQRLTIAQEARPCAYELRASPENLGSAGGRGSIAVETLEGCPWTAVSSAGWLRVLTPSSGTGPGTVSVEADANHGGRREASVSIGSRSVTISQSGPGSGGGDGGSGSSCSATVTPSTVNAVASGGTHTIGLAVNPSCEWRATSSASWAAVAPTSGRGGASITITVERNTGNARSATVTIGEQVVTVNQAAMPACTVNLDPTSASFPDTGGPGSVRVSAPDGCEWTLSTTPPAWVQQVTPTRGTGGTTDLRYVVAVNNATTSRSATLTIGGRTHTINQQAAACSYSLEPPARTFSGTGGEGTVTVNTQSGCQWSITSTPNWITVTGQTATSFSYSVPPNNTTAPRTGSIVVSGQQHTITQEAGTPTCTYSISATPQNFAADGGSGSFTVTTQQGCAWTASAAPWVGSGSWSGSGTQTMTFSVPQNNGAARQTAITLNTGPSVSITQEAAAPTCTVSVNPTSHNFPSGVGSTSVAINVQGSNCSWTATRVADWVTVTPASGASSQNVSVAVTANPATSPRQTTVTVTSGSSTATLNVTQDAATPTCTYSISANPQTYRADGGPGTFTVTAPQGCAWSASAGGTWLGGPWSGSGTQTVNISAQRNDGAQRQTAITLNTGPSVSITQEAAAPTCTYSISASPQNFAAGGGSGNFTVTTQPNCAWNASAGAPWVGGPWSGSGTQTVSFSVEPNTGAARQTAITLNTGPSVSITQDARAPTQACTYSISPGNADFGPTGGQGTVQVTTGPTCAWTASSPVDWIDLASSGGTGSGPLRYTVDPHDDDDRREASISVAGHSHRVRQEGDDDDLFVSCLHLIPYIA